MKVKVLESICEMMCEMWTLYTVEIWGVEKEWEIIDEIHSSHLRY